MDDPKGRIREFRTRQGANSSNIAIFYIFRYIRTNIYVHHSLRNENFEQWPLIELLRII